jgi:hypothetical protein
MLCTEMFYFSHSPFCIKFCPDCLRNKMQIEYPENVHLIRGNHEAADINALFGFRIECIERMVGVIMLQIFVWTEILDS